MATLAVLLCFAQVACRDDVQLPWSPGARFNTSEWMLAWHRGAATINGPRQASLRWEFKEPDLSIDAVLPMPDGSIFLCGHRLKPEHVKLKELSNTDYSKLSDREQDEYFDRIWDLHTGTDGGYEGLIVKLDSQGQEVKRLALPETADKKGWSSFSFAAYPNQRGFLVAESMRIYAEKMKAYYKLLSTPFDQMDADEFKEEDFSMVGTRGTRIAAWDLELEPIWSNDYTDTNLSISGVRVDSQGNVVLDMQKVGKQLGDISGSILWLDRQGKEASKFDFAGHKEEFGYDVISPVVHGLQSPTFAESNNGYLFARGDEVLVSFSPQRQYR
ncbi:MAG: hypothetical protein M3R04_01495, partial [bacterium]|nr:hypothetical protein [bacterium]